MRVASDGTGRLLRRSKASLSVIRFGFVSVRQSNSYVITGGFEVDDTAEWRAYQCADNYLLSHQLTTAEQRHALSQPEPMLGVSCHETGSRTRHSISRLSVKADGSSASNAANATVRSTRALEHSLFSRELERLVLLLAERDWRAREQHSLLTAAVAQNTLLRSELAALRVSALLFCAAELGLYPLTRAYIAECGDSGARAHRASQHRTRSQR